ncbi:hypothetical protein NMY22_g14747 [Coprinellus aureogranulatus]|nr:hypothetical protein NMY22_g14747 [Coprinellus aureogranulatus]
MRLGQVTLLTTLYRTKGEIAAVCPVIEPLLRAEANNDGSFLHVLQRTIQTYIATYPHYLQSGKACYSYLGRRYVGSSEEMDVAIWAFWNESKKVDCLLDCLTLLRRTYGERGDYASVRSIDRLFYTGKSSPSFRQSVEALRHLMPLYIVNIPPPAHWPFIPSMCPLIATVFTRVATQQDQGPCHK